MKMKRFNPLLLCLPLFLSNSHAGEAEDALLKAATEGDAPRIVLALAEAEPDIRGKDGQTPLMLAAAAGDFESVRRLLWAGADAGLKDNSGKIARDFLDLKGEAYAPLSLILRAYAFCHEYGRAPVEVKTKHLALINDNWVDPFHPKLKSSYFVNEAELKGKNGEDDDGNGFIDDIYGWNFLNDEPLIAPQLCIDDTEATKNFLSQLLVDYLAAAQGDEKLAEKLQNRYENPLVKQIGFGTLAAANLDLNDYVYAEMLYSASHGTHVAGIIAKYSDGKALIHGSALGQVTPPTGRVFTDTAGLVKLAENSPDYAKFVSEVITRFRAEAVKKGQRASDYLRACGAGVANMSWSRPRPYFEGMASELEYIYTNFGKNPSSVKQNYQGDEGILLQNLVLELTIADAAAFAIAFYENPDVLIVIAAGNETADNDTLLPSPPYLSRFFPNVMTVASLDENGKPSAFTNFGTRSVQIAALGENIVSPILSRLEAKMSGTSMASPLVAGVAAGIRKDFPELTATDVRRLLEASAKRSESLLTICSTSGAIDPAAARKMAASFSGDNLAMLVEEARSAKKPGRDGPIIKVPEGNSKPAPKNGPINEGGSYRITNVSGFSDSWRVTMSKDTPFVDQRQLGVGEYPAAAIEKGWKDGFQISSVAGDAGGWNVVMSTGIKGVQFVLGYELDQSQIASKMQEGFRIKHIAGWKENWITVMATETGWGLQRYTLPTPFTAERQQWIKDRWDEGYRITSVSGDDVPNDDADGWLFVMTQGTNIQEQTYSVPGPWPNDWIKENQAKGFRITSSAGAADHTIVIMSKGSGLGDQAISPDGAYPTSWISEKW
ncbi:MAG: S8 family serine peptidase [Luteolibacter sp.]